MKVRKNNMSDNSSTEIMKRIFNNFLTSDRSLMTFVVKQGRNDFYVVMIVKDVVGAKYSVHPEDTVFTFVAPLRVYGTRKMKTKSNHVIKVHVNGKIGTINSDDIYEISTQNLFKDYCYICNLSKSDTKSAVTAFINSSAWSENGISNADFNENDFESIDAVKMMLSDEEEVTTEVDQEVSEVIEAEYEEISTEVAEPDTMSDEDRILEAFMNEKFVSEQIINIHNEMLDNLIIPPDEVLDFMKRADSNCNYLQSLQENEKQLIDSHKVTIDSISDLRDKIESLKTKLTELEAISEKEESLDIGLKKSIVDIKSNVETDIRKLNSFMESAKREKAASEMRNRIDSMLSGLSNDEAEYLRSKLGISSTPAIEMKTSEIVITDGACVSDNANGYSWAEYKSHIVDVCQGHSLPSKLVFKALADVIKNGMTHATLADKLNSVHYANKAIEFCRKYGYLPEKKKYAKRRVSSDQIKNRGKAITTNSKKRKEAIEMAFNSNK